MKFGKRMRGLATKEWESGYVDYKQLKRQIRQLQDQQQQKQQQLTCGGDGDVSDTSDGPSAAQQTFLALLSHEMDKINMAHTRLQTQLEVVELGALRSALGSRWVLSPAKARSLLLDAIELSQRVDALRRFVVLNSLALVKIAKKCDKVLGTNVRSVVLEALKTQSFYDAEGLDRVCADASALTDRIMLCVLPDGNFRIDASAVACPICLCADVRTPISLACGHAFCWSCLSKAAEHRFNSCPLCRKAQSLDPRYYEIDGLLKRFKRAYAFVEQGLDRAPFAASRMRQILAEAFEVVNAHLAEIDEQYASVSPPASLCGDARESTTSELSSTATERDGLDAAVDGIDSSTTSKKQVADIDELPAPAATTIVIATSSDDAEQAEPEPPVAELVELLAFERGDPVEILASGVWYPGMVMQCNSDATYSVLWWVHDNSQRFGQKVARAQLREPLSTDDDDSSSSSSALYDAAADAWRTATEWALEPFRRLRSLSSSSERVVS